MEYEAQTATIEAGETAVSFAAVGEDPNDIILVDDGGESSDSDAFLAALNHPLSTPERLTQRTSHAQQAGSSSSGMESFLNDCSPLLQDIHGKHSELQVPRLIDDVDNTGTNRISADVRGEISENTPLPAELTAVADRAYTIRASPIASRASPVICHDEQHNQHHYQASSNNESQESAYTTRIPLDHEVYPTPDIPTLGYEAHDNYGSGSEHSSSLRRRSPSPHTPVSNRQEYATVAPVPLMFDTGGTMSSASVSARSHSSQQSDHSSSRQGNNSTAPAALRPGSPSITSSAPSSQSNGSLRERESRLKSLRRFVRKRGSKKARQTEESNQDRIQNRSTAPQSLGDEDMFAPGADPRRAASSDNTQSQHQQYTTQQHQQQSVAEYLPPVVWEESSSSESEQEELTGGRRPRALSEPSGGRLRGFLFPRTAAPGVRRRSSRQSRSVRQRLPRSSSSSGGSRPAPLSTTAAAVLFTSSQSQVSVDSSHEHDSSSLRHRQPHQRHLHPYSQQSTLLSTSTLDDSGRANMGVSTIVDRSSMGDTGVGDAMSISSIGNSAMARSDPALLRSDGSTGQQPGSIHQQLHQQPQTSGAPEHGGSNDGGENTNELDPSREARVRWVRINQRFQLMVTCVAVLFSLLLFGILLSWIVLTSAYVITFERTCDVPLKFFYFLATIQLVLDVFRNDIMRRILMWDPSSQGSTQQGIPARVVAYNILYMAYALLVLRIGITSVYVDGQQPESTCQLTAPELFNSSFVFVTLTLLAWGTIILGYLIPFCFVAVLLTWNGYNPGESVNEARVTAGPIPGGVFSGAYGSNAAPPECIDQMHQVHLGEMGENCPQECCICMEDFRMADGIVQTDCGHVLHKSCCSVWLRQARTCPVCRADIPNAQQERMRNIQQQQQQLQGGIMQEPDPDIEQQRHHHQPHHHRRPRVQLNSPRLPFRPGGRQEVETIIRAIQQAGARRPRRNSGNQAVRNARRNSSRRSSGVLRSPRNGTQRHSGESANNPSIEIAPLGHQSD